MTGSNLRSGMGVALCVAGLVLSAGAAWGQAYPVESQLRFEVWDGSAWTNNVVAQPGGRVEVRAVVSYTGPNTAVRGLAYLNYQPVFSNWDNEGASQDDLGAWRNGGESGNFIPNTMLTASEGASGAALATYGRVGYGGIAMQASFLNTMTNHRHVGGSNGAPAGSYMRAAGSFVTQWPQMNPAFWTTADGNRVGRGVVSSQFAEINALTGNANPFWVGGTSDIVIFRQAVLLSDLDLVRTISISSEEAFLERQQNNAGSTDNRRFMRWWTQQIGSGAGDYRSGVEFVAASITVVPSPAAGVVMVVGGGLLMSRRRGRGRG